MKFKFKFSALLICLTFFAQPILADPARDELIMNLAEIKYARLFPTGPTTLVYPPYRYRAYNSPDYSTQILLGINQDTQRVVLFGGPWASITDVGSAAEILLLLQPTQGGKGSLAEVCDLDSIPSGFSYSREGDIVRMSTNGQCIEVTDNNPYCEAPPAVNGNDVPVETGISVLTETNITTFALEGIDFPEIPGFENPFDAAAREIAESSACVIHASAVMERITTIFDICMDISAQLAGAGDNVRMKMAGTSTSRVVPDCFQTNAKSVFNAFTKETWVNTAGVFTKVN